MPSATHDPLAVDTYLTDGVSLFRVADVNEKTKRVFLEDCLVPDVLVEFSVPELLAASMTLVRQEFSPVP